MPEDNVHTLMTDDELDAALAALHSKPVGGPNLAPARAALAAALEQPLPEPIRKRRHWGRLASAAAVVAALVGGGLVAENLVGGDQPTASAAAMTLNRAAAAAIHEQDPVLEPGQYLYSDVDSWWSMTYLGTNTTRAQFVYIGQYVVETWVPANRNDQWMQRLTQTNNRHWIMGTEAAAKAAGIDLTAGPWPKGTSVHVAPCGNFVPQRGKKPSCADGLGGAWSNPTPDWLAGLPTSPQAMLDRLRHDTAVSGPGQDDRILATASDALRTGLVPAKTRAVLYQALALLPELKITDKVANVDGRTGVALGIDNQRDGYTQEFIVDPATGQFIGERQVTTRAGSGIPAGTVMEYTAVSASVVDAMGAAPSK